MSLSERVNFMSARIELIRSDPPHHAVSGSAIRALPYDSLRHSLDRLRRPRLIDSALARCLLLFFVSFIAGAGCGPTDRIQIAPVTGIVRYNGAAVKGAYVQFSKAGAPIVAAAHTDDTGKFTLTSYQKDDGAPVGENKVIISLFPPINDDRQEMEAKRAEIMKIADPNEQARKLDEIAGSRKKRILEQRKKSAKLNKLPERYASEATSSLSFNVKAGVKNECEFDLTDN
jgi:hypothetical protein